MNEALRKAFVKEEENERKIESALKLQELVKEQLPLLIKSRDEFKEFNKVEYDFQRAKVEVLQFLVEESEK